METFLWDMGAWERVQGRGQELIRSWLCLLLAVQPWLSDFTSLNLFHRL